MFLYSLNILFYEEYYFEQTLMTKRYLLYYRIKIIPDTWHLNTCIYVVQHSVENTAWRNDRGWENLKYLSSDLPNHKNAAKCAEVRTKMLLWWLRSIPISQQFNVRIITIGWMFIAKSVFIMFYILVL